MVDDEQDVDDEQGQPDGGGAAAAGVVLELADHDQRIRQAVDLLAAIAAAPQAPRTELKGEPASIRDVLRPVTLPLILQEHRKTVGNVLLLRIRCERGRRAYCELAEQVAQLMEEVEEWRPWSEVRDALKSLTKYSESMLDKIYAIGKMFRAYPRLFEKTQTMEALTVLRCVPLYDLSVTLRKEEEPSPCSTRGGPSCWSGAGC